MRAVFVVAVVLVATAAASVSAQQMYRYVDGDGRIVSTTPCTNGCGADGTPTCNDCAPSTATCNGDTLPADLKLPASGPIGLEGDRGQMEYPRLRIRQDG